MAIRTGPMIEGVVSRTASADTRRRALEGGTQVASGGVTQGARQPGTAFDFFMNQNTQQLANAGNLNQTTATAAAQAAQMPGTNPQVAFNQTMQSAGWVRNNDGTWTHTNTGKVTDAGGETIISGPNTGGDPTGPGGGTTPPTGPGAAAGDPDAEGLGGLGDVSREAIEAQINALTAQYGLDLEGIAALGGQIGAQARFLMAQLNRDQGFAQEGLLGNLVGRGVFRSGITARDTGRLQGDFAAKRAEVEMNKGQQLRQLAERAGMSKVGLARGKADVISEIDRANLPAELRQVLLNELNSLTPEQIQQAIDSSRGNTPRLNLGQDWERQPQDVDEELNARMRIGGGQISGMSPIKF